MGRQLRQIVDCARAHGNGDGVTTGQRSPQLVNAALFGVNVGTEKEGWLNGVTSGFETTIDIAPRGIKSILVGDDDRALTRKTLSEHAGGVGADTAINGELLRIAGRLQRPLDQFVFSRRRHVALDKGSQICRAMIY